MEEQRRTTKTFSSRIIPQFHISTEKKSRMLYNSFNFKRLSSHILSKRVLIEGMRWTLPFGYTKEMVENPFFHDNN